MAQHWDEPAPTSAPLRMDGMWTGNNFSWQSCCIPDYSC